MTKSKQSPVALAVRAATDSLSLTFQHSAMVAQHVAVENGGIAAETRLAIVSLRSALSGAEYLSACVAIFGTSGVHHSKPEYQPGALRTMLESLFERDAKTTGEDAADYLNRIKFRLSQARSVAVWLADPVNYAKACEEDDDGNVPTLNDLDKVRRGTDGKKRTPKVADAEQPGDVKLATADAVIAAAIATFGFGPICNALADAMNDRKGAKLTAEGLKALAKVA